MVWLRSDEKPKQDGLEVSGGLGRARRFLPPVLDSVMWLVALVLATAARLEADPATVLTGRLVQVAALAVVLEVSIGYASGLYRVRWRLASFEEATSLALTIAATTALLLGIDESIYSKRHGAPAGAVLIGGALTFVAAAGTRSVWRILSEHKTRARPEAQRAVIFGAGSGAAQLIDSLLRFDDAPLIPVALLDDHPAKRASRIRHLRVSGGRDDIEVVAARTKATAMVIAIPSAESALIRELSERALNASLTVFVLPPVAELLKPSTVAAADLRRLTYEDLLGRNPVSIDLDSIASYVQGRSVLVTGAGGSIGSELCRQLHAFSPARLVMLDRDESGLHQTQLSIEGRAMLDTRTLVVCDIRDCDALRDVFDEHKPNVVFHAAALKHLPLLEMWPLEAVKTNIVATNNVLEEALRVGTATFVNISTDKAANPTSVLGYTKRIAERLTAAAGARSGPTDRYISVRFGNVLGSRGSVLTAFQSQIAAGGPVTVTHPDVTRYFMTVHEAVQLVVQAGAIGTSGEVMILEMGDPVPILSVARQLIAESDREINITYTGLRPGEKLTEDLFATNENPRKSTHPLVWATTADPIDYDTLPTELYQPNPPKLTTLLRDLSNQTTLTPAIPRDPIGKH